MQNYAIFCGGYRQGAARVLSPRGRRDRASRPKFAFLVRLAHDLPREVGRCGHGELCYLRESAKREEFQEELQFGDASEAEFGVAGKCGIAVPSEKGLELGDQCSR